MKASTFLALMTGLAAGVVLGIMIAPQNGEENRKEFRRKVDEFLDKHCSAKADCSSSAEDGDAAAEEPSKGKEAPAHE